MNALLLTDFYKTSHKFQYPDNTEVVYSNFTARTSRINDVNHVIFFGLQYFIKKYLIEEFNVNFFHKPIQEILHEYSRVIRHCLGADLPSYQHIIELHSLGYLPLEIKALSEGSIVPIKIPMLTITNTIKSANFSWLVNWVESLMSSILWQPITSATIANEYRKNLQKFALKTGSNLDFVKFQGHDFSFRGMSSLETACLSGMGHLTSFVGTDTIPAILSIEKYYNANIEKELIGCSVSATEHSVMCAGGNLTELETFNRLITQVYPNGIISIVSDTWDLWQVCTEYLPILKDKILAREGKVVIRPDSGNPVDIICGDINSKNSNSYKGVIELLWDIFGGTINNKGFKVLDSHIGAIYGDSITLEIANKICTKLQDKGFASENMVFGIGSYSYQYNTRDTFGMAMKATYAEINSVPTNLMKNPITDSGVKKSATGLLKVEKNIQGELLLIENVNQSEEKNSCLEPVFIDGHLLNETSFMDIRAKIASYDN